MYTAKAELTIEELDEIGIDHENGWLTENLVRDKETPYLIGGIAEVTEEYIDIEWWCPVVKDTIRLLMIVNDGSEKK